MISPPNLSQFRLPSSRELSGQTFTADLDGGGVLELRLAETTVTWRAEEVFWAGAGSDLYEAVAVAPGTWFVDIGFADRPLDALTVIIDETKGWLLAIHQCRRPDAVSEETRTTAVTHTFAAGWLHGRQITADAGLPHATLDLVGGWHRYRYSEANLYEHVYISAERMVSHNLRTANTPGRADCHPVSYWALGEDRYVVAWREFDSQMAAIAFEDLSTGRVTGKALAPTSPHRSTNAPLGGFISRADVRFPTTTEESDQ